MTWHPIQRQSANLKSPRSIEPVKLSENQQFKRSVSAPWGANAEQNINRIKLGTVTREKQIFTRNSHQTPSPTR